MATIVLRVRLVSGDRVDVSYQERDAADEAELVERAVAALADDSGALLCRHGGRTIVLFGRGVAAVEVSPRGAVL